MYSFDQTWRTCICSLNSLWSGNAIWRHGTRSTLAQVMAITWTNVDLLSVWSLGIHFKELSLDHVKIPISRTMLKIAVFKWHLGLPGVNELNMPWCAPMLLGSSGIRFGKITGILCHRQAWTQQMHMQLMRRIPCKHPCAICVTMTCNDCTVRGFF